MKTPMSRPRGIYIWKYKRHRIGATFFPLPEPLLFGMILSGIALVALCLAWNECSGSGVRKMLYLVMVLLITVLMVAGAMNIGRVTAGMMMTLPEERWENLFL